MTGKVLAALPDAALLEILVDAVATRLGAGVTCCTRAADALDVDCIDPHHLIVTGLELPDMSGFDLIAQLLELRRRPVILLVKNPSVDDAIRALRCGVMDIITAPIDAEYLFTAMANGLHQAAADRKHTRREHRRRTLIRRVLRDRRQLNQRIDLICKDMVGAHRRLFHRVLATQSNPTTRR